MNKQEHALVLGRYTRDDKAARKEARTDEQSIDKRRIAFQHEGRELRGMIAAITDAQKEIAILDKEIAKAKPENRAPLEARRGELEARYMAIFNMSSLKGTVVLFEGLSLLCDMMSVEQRVKNKRTGERYYVRTSLAEVLMDVAGFTQESAALNLTIANMINTHGLKAGHWSVGAMFDPSEYADDADEDDDAPANPAELGPVSAGVPAADLASAADAQSKVVKLRDENAANHPKS